MKRGVLLIPLILLGGCISTVGSVVTAPVRVVSKTVDWTTTSQEEADRNRGRKLRKAEKHAWKECRRVRDGDDARAQCVRERLRNEGY